MQGISPVSLWPQPAVFVEVFEGQDPLGIAAGDGQGFIGGDLLLEP